MQEGIGIVKHEAVSRQAGTSAIPAVIDTPERNAAAGKIGCNIVIFSGDFAIAVKKKQERIACRVKVKISADSGVSGNGNGPDAFRDVARRSPLWGETGCGI